MWRTLTNRELAQAIRRIVNTSSSKEEVNRRAKDELDYPYSIDVSYSEPNSRGDRMSMFMAHAKDGSTLS